MEEATYYSEKTADQNYDELFPALPETGGPGPGAGVDNAWNSAMRVGPSIVTQVFHVPGDEKRYENDAFGEKESLRMCTTIMRETDAQIEMSSSKNGSLTFLVSGKHDSVIDARRRILTTFQTQASTTVVIPKAHHKVILGKSGQRLKELEKHTATKISVPSITDSSDRIVITGTRESVEKAAHQINLISAEQAKKASEVITVEKELHPFIVGAHGEALTELQNRTGARVHVPPPSINSDEITVAGERPGVDAAVQAIRAQVAIMKKHSTVSIEVKKAQHKYIIGPRGSNIAEILQECGVSVEVPPLDSSLETITLRGPQDKLGGALSKVYQKANSGKTMSVEAPSWLHRHIVGRKGANIRAITQDYPKVHVELHDKLNQCTIEGPPEEVDEVHTKLKDYITILIDSMTHEQFTVDPKHFKHIIGKNGANINRLKDQTGVSINITDAPNQSIITIEGTKDGVMAAKQELTELIHKMDSEKEKDVIIEFKYHRLLIGQKGEKIRSIRENFPNVQIVFPPAEQKSELVKIRGPKEDVDKCSRMLVKTVKELMESNYSVQIPAYEQCQKYIIGKGGANIRKLREETSTQIEMQEDRNIIIITGRKENVEIAKNRIMTLQNEQISMVTDEIKISPKLFNSIIGPQGKIINSIEEECGVKITIPPPDSNSDKVTIMGLADGVGRAKLMLMEQASDRELHSYTDTVRANPQHHKFLIGKSGSKIKKIRESTGARIMFPTEKTDDKEVITIIGTKEAVEQAKTELLAQIEKIDSVKEIGMDIDQKHHKHFVFKRGEVLHKLEDMFAGVTISFPRSGVKSTRVTIKGPPDMVEPVREKMAEIVRDLEERITIEVEIPQCHHRNIMGPKGTKVQNIESMYDVKIKIPERNSGEEEPEEGMVNGGPRKCDLIKVTGKPENVALAETALKNSQPITVEVEVPYDYHGGIIGNKGQSIRDMMDRFDVNIEVPNPEKQQNTIKITGAPEAVEAAKDGLAERIRELEHDREDRILRSHRVTIEVDPEFHPKIIGHRGNIVTKIKSTHDVLITIPKRGDPDERIITISGYEANAEAARKEIEQIVNRLNELFRKEVEIDSRVHSRLIGSKGRSIKKFMEDYNVEIKFPRPADPNPNLVVISADDEQNLLDATDKLISLEEEYLDDVMESQQYKKEPNRYEHKGGGGGATGFVVKGAPWEMNAPDVGSTKDFPTFSGSKENSEESESGKPMWGPRR